MKMNKKKYFAVYTVIFAILFFLCFGVYLYLYHKSFFRGFDGFDQHYMSFLYLGKWGRSIVRNLFEKHQLLIPLWNPAIGYGGDVPTSFAAYMWDPFNWISFFIPERYAEIGYAIMIIMKFYACGIAYSIFAMHRKHPFYAILCGAIIYTFSAVNYVGFYQSFFINPLIIFPLLIMGVDRLFDDHKPGLYVAMLAISFITYFYFAYMMCILVFLYCIMKLVFSKTVEKTAGNIMHIVLQFLLYSVLAAGISAVSLLPSLIVMLQAGRIGLPHYLPVMFNKAYYSGLFTGWTTMFNMLGRDCNIGWGAIALICAIVLFLRPGKDRQIKTEFILMTAGLCIPFVGHVMNGMSYTANRWVFAYDLVVALIVTMMIPELKKLTVSKKVTLFIVSMIYILICSGYFKVNDTRMHTAEMIIAVICVFCFFLSKMTDKNFKKLMILISGICVIVPSSFTYRHRYGHEFENHMNAGTAYSNAVNSDGLPLVNDIDDKDQSRIDNYIHGLGATRNTTWLYDVSGINFYISMYNNDIDRFHSALAMNQAPSCYSYYGLNKRSELEALLGVNHYFTTGDNVVKPEGFERLASEKMINGVQAQSYQADKQNSLFYTFDQKISYDEFEKLSPYERQQVLMQALVTDEEYSNAKVKDLYLQNNEVQYALKPHDGVKVNDKTIIVNKDGGQVELNFPDVNNSEIYLYFNHINYARDQAISYSINTQVYDNDTQIQNLQDSFSGYTWYCHMYGRKLNWLLTLGDTKQNCNKIIITFNNAGTYTLRDLKLYAKPIEEIQKNISGLQRKVTDIKRTNNRYSCDVKLQKDQTLFTTVPYSDGWTAYDNGKKIEIHKTDIAFMSFDLKQGSHHIELVYRTPGLYLGAFITVCSLLLYVLISKHNRKSIS